MLPLECVVRGYITGSGWKDYRATGDVCGHTLPAGPARSRSGCPSRSSRRRRRRRGPRREHHARPGGRARRARALRRGRAHRARALPLRGGARARARDHPRRHEVRARRRRGRRGSCSADEAFTPDSSRFWPADQYEPGGPQPSFDKQFVRDYCESLGWDKTYPGAGAARRRRRGTRAQYVEAFERLTGIPFDALRRRPGVGAAMRATVLVRPKQGILDPQGQAVEQSLRQLGFAVEGARVGRVVDLERRGDDRGRGARAELERMCEQLLANPLIESYEIEVATRHERARPRDRSRHVPRLERRPGRRSGARGARRGAPCPSGTRSRSCPTVGAVVLPGGFSYGDYLRAGALARFAPVMEAVRRIRRRRRPRPRDLQRLPGPLRGRPAAGCPPAERVAHFVCRDVRCTVERTDTPFTMRCTAGQRLTIPVKHGEGCFFADAGPARRARGGGPGRPSLRGREPERLGRPHRRHRQRRGQRAGAHAASRACRRSA